VGFALPHAIRSDDVVYHEPVLAGVVDVPVPSGLLPPGGPPLAHLVPAPPEPRDPTQPFGGLDDADAPPITPRDPRTPLLLDAGHSHPDDILTDDALADFPAPTGRPVAAAAPPAWQPGAYPPPGGVPVAGPPQPWHPAGPPQPWHAGGPPAANPAQLARPAPWGPPPPPGPTPLVRPTQPTPAPAAAWATYRPPTTRPASSTPNIWMLLVLGAGILFPALSWLLLSVAWFIGMGTRGLRTAVTIAFAVSIAAVVFVWALETVFNVYLLPQAADPLTWIVARIACAACLVVALADWGLAWYRRRSA